MFLTLEVIMNHFTQFYLIYTRKNLNLKTLFYHTTQKIEAVFFFSFCRTYTLIDKVISQFGEEIQKVKDRSKRKETP